MSGLLLLCTELTLLYIELPENCIYLNQSELSNFSMYIIIRKMTRPFQLCGHEVLNAYTRIRNGSPSMCRWRYFYGRNSFFYRQNFHIRG